MNYLSKVPDEWIPLQNKVFTRWVSSHINSFDKKGINDITKDLSNGVALIELAENLTHKKAPNHWAQHPNFKVEEVTNCDIAIDMFQKDGVQIVGISGKDINDNNQKLILGLIWSLIYHYSIGQSINNSIHYEVDTSDDRKDNNEVMEVKHSAIMDKAIKEANRMALLSWAEKRIRNYPNIKDFVPYELIICALLDSYFPEKVKYENLKPENHLDNLKLAISIMKDLNIPVYVYPEDLSKNNNKVDMKTLLTQLSSAKIVLDNVVTHDNSNAEKQSASDYSQRTESNNRANVELAKIEKAEEEREARISKMEADNKEHSQKVQNTIQKTDNTIQKVENSIQVPVHKNSDKIVNVKSKLVVESYPKAEDNVIVKEHNSNEVNTQKTINIGIGIKKNQTIKNIKQIGETKIINGRRVKTIRVGIKIKAKHPGQLDLLNHPQIAVVPLPGDEYRRIQIKNIKITAKHNGKITHYTKDNAPIIITTN